MGALCHLGHGLCDQAPLGEDLAALFGPIGGSSPSSIVLVEHLSFPFLVGISLPWCADGVGVGSPPATLASAVHVERSLQASLGLLYIEARLLVCERLGADIFDEGLVVVSEHQLLMRIRLRLPKFGDELAPHLIVEGVHLVPEPEAIEGVWGC